MKMIFGFVLDVIRGVREFLWPNEHSEEWVVEGEWNMERHRMHEGKVQVWCPYPLERWMGCIHPEHVKR